MSPEKRSRTLHYRKAKYVKYCEIARDEPLPSLSLEEAFIKALTKISEQGETVERVVDNFNYTEQLDNSGGGFIAEKLGHSGIIFTARRGDMVAAKGESERGATVIMAQPKDINNAPRDPATKIVYFAIYGNHVVYFSDSSNSDERIRGFLNWLLKTKTNIISEFFGIELEAKLTSNIKARIKRHGVKQIHLNSNTEATVINNFSDKLKALFFNFSTQERDAIIETPADRRAALNACQFSLTISTGKKDTGIKQEALAFYCANLSDNDLAQLSLVLGDGSRVKEGELITETKVDIVFLQGVISPTSARKSLVDWLIQLKQDGSIA